MFLATVQEHVVQVGISRRLGHLALIMRSFFLAFHHHDHMSQLRKKSYLINHVLLGSMIHFRVLISMSNLYFLQNFQFKRGSFHCFVKVKRQIQSFLLTNFLFSLQQYIVWFGCQKGSYLYSIFPLIQTNHCAPFE